MPSESNLHAQDLRERGEVPDLYSTFGKLQVFLTLRAGSDLTYRALRELANVIGLPTWVVTPEMLLEMWGVECRPRGRKQWNAERELVKVEMSIFCVDVRYWVERIAPDREEEIDEALRRFCNEIRNEGSVFQKPRRRPRCCAQ